MVPKKSWGSSFIRRLRNPYYRKKKSPTLNHSTPVSTSAQEVECWVDGMEVMGTLQGSLTHVGAEVKSMKLTCDATVNIESDCGAPKAVSCNIGPSQLNPFGAGLDISSGEASVEDAPKPSNKLPERISPCGENGPWQLQAGRLVRLNKKKCEHLSRWLAISSGECGHSTTRASAKSEFCAVVERANYLVEECCHEKWLLKAVELWGCSEHFVEVLLDLCWSAHLMSLGGVETQSKEWMLRVEELLDSRREWNDVAALFHEDCNEDDRNDLDGMVQVKLMDKTLRVDGPEHQLAHLLQDRLKNQNLWLPPFLKSHRFFIRSRFLVPSRRSSRTGAHGAILIFSWVYKKEFALKMRHPGEDDQKTFKWEFDILDKYRSPYIVGVVGYWEARASSWRNPFSHRTVPFLLMEMLESDLKNLMDRCKSIRGEQAPGFSALETICLMLPVAKALRFLHGKDVAHRDVKPQNIMCNNTTFRKGSVVKEDTVVKLIDFGEAREVSRIPIGTLGPAGTPGYMDPTMWKQGVVGYTPFMGDVFSFALAFTELLTWRSPGKAFGVSCLRDAQQELKADKRPPLPSDLPDYLRFIVESCWHADHLKRPDFKAICSMLQHAKILLLDRIFEADDADHGLFSYEDATGGYCCLSDDQS